MINADKLPGWAKVVSVLKKFENQSRAALEDAGVTGAELERAVASGHARKMFLIGGGAVYSSTVKGRKSLLILKSEHLVAYSRATKAEDIVPAPYRAVDFKPYAPQPWVIYRPGATDAANVPSRGFI